MFSNYFKTAWRNLMKNKFYSAINIAGLAIGLTVGIMILLWVQDELSYNSFHSKADHIYKINSHIGSGPGAQIWSGSPGAVAAVSKQSVPEVVHAVRINRVWGQIQFTYKDKKIIENGIAHVDSSFFSVFDFKLLKGNAAKPFTDIHSIIVTSSVAKKHFGEEEPIGKVLVANNENFTVTGVVEDFPENSDIRFNILLPMSLYAKEFTESGGNGNWKTIDEDLGNFQYATYLQLQNNASPEVVGKKVTQLYKGKRNDESNTDFFTLQPLTTTHLVTASGNTGALQNVRIFLLVAILILCIACINYVNLSTARSMLRSKEVSVRKIIGAEKTQLFIQFIIESAVLFMLAAVLAFCLIYFLLPVYNSISGKHLLFSLGNKNVWVVVGGAVLGTLIMASIYPALLLSSFKPIQALKGKLSLGIGNTSFRKVLVVTQFVFSVGLIISTIVISYQQKFIKNKDLGFDKEHVFSFALQGGTEQHQDAIRADLLKQPGVLGVASGNSVVGMYSSTGDTDWDGKEKNSTFLIHAEGIDEKLIPLLNMQLVAGKNFAGSKADSINLILNETAIKQAGITDPIGKRFTLWGTNAIIIGVVKDFNYASLKQAIEPAAFYYKASNSRLYIKTTGNDAPKVIAAAKKIWKQYSTGFPFEYAFLEDEFNRMYQSEQRTGTLFNLFAAVAIIISCLGLFGLATYTAEIKVKEIGIRKVLGASVTNITRLLAKEFILLVVIAFIIAAPVAWYAMSKWLQDYAYRINLDWWIFAATGIMAVVIALLTVCFQAIKAAMANPVKSLRSE